jgi:hypothetical protein
MSFSADNDRANMANNPEVTEIIRGLNDWRGKTLAQIRTLVKKADAELAEEVKWKKPSRPEGVPVWEHDGIVCVGEALKNAVRLTFPKGARINASKTLFNARLESNTVRAIDFHQDDPVDEAALGSLILEAVALNTGHSASGDRDGGIAPSDDPMSAAPTMAKPALHRR